MEFLEAHWREPDEGIWEVRGPRRHFTHSKVMAWVAVDRAVKAVEQFGLDGPGRALAARSATEIHAEVCETGFDADRNTFTQSYGRPELDASLLMIPLVGFLPATTRGSSAPSRRSSASCCATASSSATPTTAAARSTACRRRRGRVPALHVLAGRQLRPPGPPRRRPRRCSSGCCGLRQRRRPARRGVRPERRPAARQLPAGVHPRGADQHRPQPRPTAARRTRVGSKAETCASLGGAGAWKGDEMRRFLRNNGLALVTAATFLVIWFGGQTTAGLRTYNAERRQDDRAGLVRASL